MAIHAILLTNAHRPGRSPPARLHSLTSSGPPVSERITVDTDVVVVGAGISGLTVARSLVAAGLDVVVLEARNRVGGRLLSVPCQLETPDQRGALHQRGPLDLGATWFWPNEPRIAALLSELGVKAHAQHLAGDAMYQDTHGTQRLRGNPIDVVSGRISLGAQELAHAVARELPHGTVRFDHPVTVITDATSSAATSATADEASTLPITARTAAGTFRCAHLVLATPPALAISAIEFIPGLDEATATVARRTPVWMGAVTKVVARYPSPFWRDRGLAGAAISHVGPLQEIHDMSGPDGHPAALFGFASPTGIGSPAISTTAVLSQLVTMFGSEAADPEELVIHDWRDEVWTSPPGVEGLQAYDLFGHPCYAEPALGGRLHWASTETTVEYPGHIEGALAAASRAADAIIYAMRR